MEVELKLFLIKGRLFECRINTQWWLSGFSYEPAFSGWSNYFSDGDVLFLD